MIKSAVYFIILALVSVPILVARSVDYKTIQINTDDAAYNVLVELANTRYEQSRGLSRHTSLNEDEGMLFVYEADVEAVFWMKDMRFPLDMFFIESDGVINHIEEKVPLCGVDSCSLYKSDKPVRYVLELVDGFAEKYNVEVGDTITFEN
ncbi:DUF192 domain-containing protein [Patescibacteria group bacterium]|nr:DUF192 domain-containing protein [Patescibacteria group bacterium]MBU1682603.1 DUF192 domain-containing protein [Patescibacteria group bacterium]MBU1935658.1 DUF192 domain-containing protein [Patescibacteria group bacterium]